MSYCQPRGATSLPGGRDNEEFNRPRLSKLFGFFHFSFKMNVLVPLFWGEMLLSVVSVYQKRPLESYPAMPLDVVYCICTSLKRNLSAYGFWRWVLCTKPLCFPKRKFSPSNLSFFPFLFFFHQYANNIKDTIQVNGFLAIQNTRPAH